MLFKNKKLNAEKILSNGFQRDGDKFTRREEILNMTLTIIIDNQGSITTKIIDTDGEPYTLHFIEGASGSFVGSVKNAYEKILADVAANCFDDEIFKSAQTTRLVDYIQTNFAETPEFLWEKFPNYAVFRRKDNRKWYAVIMSVPRNKLGLDGAEELEILNLRVEPQELDKIFDDEKYFRGWHMNKRSWLTLRLDETLSFEEISARLAKSYQLAARK